MAGKQAKILSVDALNSLLAYASSTRHPVRNTAIVLLSVKAGLRAGEIANLTWPMVLNADGELGVTIALHDKAAKKGSGRTIPMHPQLAEALHALASQSYDDGYVITSERGGQMTALSIVIWFRRAFAQIGLKGCSSHSGRRTFITRAAEPSTRPAAHYGMCNCSPAMPRSRPPNDILTATATPSADWWG